MDEASEPMVSIVEPGEGCFGEGLRAVARLACWLLLVSGLTRGVFQRDQTGVLVGIAAGVVLLLLRRSGRGGS